MKTISEYINNSQESQVNESFLSVGLTIIVSSVLASMAIKSISAITQIFKAVKEGIATSKEYNGAIKQLDALLQPYKEELMKTEWGSKLFAPEGIINNSSVKEKGCAIIFWGLNKDIESVLSDEDYKKYKDIIKPIYDVEHTQHMREFIK